MARRPHEDMKTEIVALASGIISRERLAGLSARRLALEAGCSVGTLYNLFGDLDGVVRAANLASMEALGASLAAALEKAAPAQEPRLLALAEAYFDFADADPRRWEALFRLRPDAAEDPSLAGTEAGLFALLRKAAGNLPEEALRALWAAVHGVVELAIRRRLAGSDGAGERYYARLVVMAGLRGLAALRAEGLG